TSTGARRAPTAREASNVGPEARVRTRAVARFGTHVNSDLVSAKTLVRYLSTIRARATEAVAKERPLVYGENAVSLVSNRDLRSRRRRARESVRLRGRRYGESPRGSQRGCGSLRPAAGRRG